MCAGDLPDGQITSFRQIRFVQPFLQKDFALSEAQISRMVRTVLTPFRGRIAIVTDVGSGMRWTYWRS
jgi:hypothetical protein